MVCIGSVNVNFDIWEITEKTRRNVLQPLVISFKYEIRNIKYELNMK